MESRKPQETEIEPRRPQEAEIEPRRPLEAEIEPRRPQEAENKPRNPQEAEIEARRHQKRFGLPQIPRNCRQKSTKIDPEIQLPGLDFSRVGRNRPGPPTKPPKSKVRNTLPPRCQLTGWRGEGWVGLAGLGWAGWLGVWLAGWLGLAG